MPIGFGIGISHYPGMYDAGVEEWQRNFVDRINAGIMPPQPAANFEEDLPETVQRVAAAHDEIRRALEAYKPDLMILVAGDQAEVFDRSNVPQLLIYLGEKAWGNKPSIRSRYANLEPEKIEFNIDVEFSKWLLDKLVLEENFDVSFSNEFQSLGRRPGLPHAFNNPPSVLFTNLNVPTVLLYQNTYDPPSLSAKRCYDLGAALARLTKNDPRRIAILGSGGLSHDPGGRRFGWVDEPLDRWFLDCITRGSARDAEAMFTFDSDAFTNGTGETRAWFSVAGAMEEMGTRAELVDYIPSGKGAQGISFAYWSTEPVLAH